MGLLEMLGPPGQLEGLNVPAEYVNPIMEAARKNNISARVLASLLKTESNFNPNAYNPSGAAGIAQFMPATAREVGIEDVYNPYQSIEGSAKYLAKMVNQFGSIPLGLAAYNAGPGRVRRAGGIPNFPETQNYVSKIKGLVGDATEPIDPNSLLSILGIIDERRKIWGMK